MDLSLPPTPERIVEGFGPLMPVAHMLARLQRLLADPESGLEDISELIRLDFALASRVVQISNSAWFGGSTPCRTILDAVSRVGFKEVYHLVSIIASNAVVARRLVAYRQDPETLWRESVACADAAEILADRLGEDTGAAYMSGLLHAIGRVPVDHYLVTSHQGAKPLTNEGFPGDFSGGEFALLGFSQADVGAVMLKKWEFAKATIEPVQWQYDPLNAPEPNDRAAAIIYGARLLRTAVCQTEPIAETANDAEIFTMLRLNRDELMGIVPELQERLDRDMKIAQAQPGG